jgi:hypothetical protein
MKTRAQFGSRAVLALLAVALCGVGTAAAQLPIPPSTQFDISGFLQEAALDPACTLPPAHCGGTLKVNGHLVRVPAETIVILPANALTWQELFAQAPSPYTGVATGMALADVPAPLTTYEVHVAGNRVLPDANHATDQYIAGLIDISQNGLNSGAGFISFIDYTLGEMRVGGIVDDPSCAQGGTFLTNPLCSGTRVRLNDPIVAALGTGRYGAGQSLLASPDRRFTVDQDNPTIKAATGFPMCLARVAPPSVDPLCPQGNRPLDALGNFATSIQMPDPATLAAGQLPDPRIQVPFEVGDYVSFAGTLVSDAIGGATVGPYAALGTAGTYVSAHTITNNVAVFTWPGTNPAYIQVDTALIGTGGLIVLGAGEAVVRTRFEGMMTDPTRLVHLYGIDVDPATGATTDRDWGMIGVDPGPPVGANKGRWRFRPPCDPTLVLPTDKKCTPPPGGTFLPPTREMRAVIVDAATGKIAANAGFAATAANGIIWGQYHAPITEYIFPENIPGTPIVENNFNTIDFLAQGGYTSSAGTLVGRLDPWPSNVIPVPVCAPPAPSAGGPYTVASGGTVALAASSTGKTPITFAWTAQAGTFSDAAIADPLYDAPLEATQTTLSLTLTATNACGTASASTTVTVNAAAAPTVSHIPAVTVNSGAPVSITATGTDPASLPLTFVWTQTGGAPVVLNPNPFPGATISFTVTLPSGAPATTLQFQVVATNSAGVSSAPEFTSVTVSPLADLVTITSAEYRTGKQRLILNATSSVVSPAVVLTLQPYVTTLGTTFNPCSLGCTFTNNGGGLYLLDISGAPEPAVPPATPLTVKSSLGGSAASGLTRIRQ